MLLVASPGHRTFNHLQPPQTSTLFHSVPKTKSARRTLSQVLERDGLFCDGFTVIRTKEMGVACELQFTFDAQRQTRRSLVMFSAYLQNPEAQVEPLVSLLASRGWGTPSGLLGPHERG
jgi:hypothetical protein